MTTVALLRILSLAAVVVAAPAGAQSAAQPAPAPAQTPRTLPPIRQQPRAVPPPALPALPSAQQTPTRPVVLPPTPIVKDTARVAAQAAASVTPLADFVPATATIAPAAAAAPPLPITNQPGLPPANATGRCKDGTYLTGTAATDANCSTHGGLGVAFQAPSAAPRGAP